MTSQVSPVHEGAATSERTSLRLAVPVSLLALAALGWWWSARMATDMRSMSGGVSMGGMSMEGTMGMGGGGSVAMSLASFVVAWLAMMTAMMFPAIVPVVKLFGRAAAAGRVAPVPFFVGGYITVWTALGIPAYFAWRALEHPLAEGMPWAGRLAGGVLVAAAVWQLTPLKNVCLRHCRSPMSVFMQFGRSAEAPFGALRMGAAHGAYCVGCCWALMAVLVAVGTMNLLWMVGLAALIMLEKNAPAGERIAAVGAALLAVLGIVLLVDPSKIVSVI